MMEVGSARGKEDGVVAAKRGVKRQADESNLSDDQRFTKRFNLLTLGNHQQLYHTAAGASSADASAHASSHVYIPLQDGVPAIADTSEVSSSHDQAMDVDDTKDRIYIGDLDAEIADMDAHQPAERLIFLPDIEKHFSRIPLQLLTGTNASADLRPEDQQLVLYSVPRSLTVDQEHDSVRKAIVDARHRARDRAQELAREEDMSRKYASNDDDHAVETAHGYSTGYHSDTELDVDAMDIG